MSTGTREPLLTRAQLDAWATFGPEWEPFKKAWLARGFMHPPSGSPDDDDDVNSQRHLLWQVLDDRPGDIARWVRRAPGKKPREVVGYILDRYHDLRREVDDLEDEPDPERVRGGHEPEALRAILRRIG